MKKALGFLMVGAAALALASAANAQSGSVSKAVGGYTFEDAAKEAAGTKDFHSADGQLTFAIVTHTAGNGFFDPVYVGAKVAADLIGAKLLLLGSEVADRRSAREIEILNQIIQDPTHRRPDHDDAAGRRLRRHRQGRARRPAFRSPRPTPSTAASSTAAASATPARMPPRRRSAARRWRKCLLDKGVESGSIMLPVIDRDGQRRGQQPRHRGLQRDRQGTARTPASSTNFKVDAGPENVGVDADPQRSGERASCRCSNRAATWSAPSPANNVFTPALAKAVAQMGKTGQICAFGFDLGPAQQEAHQGGDLTGALGQQPFLQGFWPVMQLYLQIDRGIAAANLDTRAQLVTKDTVEQGRQALRELSTSLTADKSAGGLLPSRISVVSCLQPFRSSP